MDPEKLSKKQKRLLQKEERILQQERENRQQKLTKIGLVSVVILVIGLGLWWLVAQSTKPLPGQPIEQLNREHVKDISSVRYSSDPPTSGPHFDVWAKRGVYDRIISDGYLIHSLEHGYIVIFYNCGPKTNDNYQKGEFAIPKVSAQDGAMAALTPDSPPSVIKELPKEFLSNSCKKLVSDLITFLDSYQRIVIVPRPSLTHRITLTAWGRMETFEKFDHDKMQEFIEAFHNKGPEQTIE